MLTNKVQLRASATTRPQDLAGAIAKYITHDHEDVEIVAVGAGSLNQAIKGVIIARRFVASSGVDLLCIPAFRTITVGEKEITAIVINIVCR